MAIVILVRHSISAPDPCVAPAQWPLSEAGRQRCAALAEALRPYLPAAIFTSQEAKASETAALVGRALGAAYKPLPGLQEHRRTTDDWLSQAEFQAAVQALFERPAEAVFGQESADAAYTRFAAAVAQALEAAPEGNVIIVTHGVVMSLFAGRTAGLEPLAVWRRLKMPAVVVLARDGLALEQVIEEVGADGDQVG